MISVTVMSDATVPLLAPQLYLCPSCGFWQVLFHLSLTPSEVPCPVPACNGQVMRVAVSTDHVFVSNVKRVAKHCEREGCDRSFLVHPSRTGRRFCSRACANQWKRTLTGDKWPNRRSAIQGALPIVQIAQDVFAQ